MIENIAIGLINEPNFAHRVDMDEQSLYQLADSIRTEGLHQPIIVRPVAGDRYEIVAGHRRYRAHLINGALYIPAIVKSYTDTDTERARLSENVQREQLSPMEEARALARISELNNYDLEGLAKWAGKSPAWIEQRLSLLELPDDLQVHVHSKDLSMASALILARVDDDEHRRYLTTYALSAGAAASTLRAWADEWQLAKERGAVETAPRPDMPAPGEPVIIMVPCAICGDPTDHTKTRILRTCAPCAGEISRAAGG